MRSVLTGHLSSELFRLPIQVYIGADIYNLSGELFHEDCGGKIVGPLYCQEHPQEESPETYSAIRLTDKLVRLDRATKAELLGRNLKEFRVVSTHKLSSLSALMEYEGLVFGGLWLAQLQKPDNPHLTLPEENFFAALLHRLATKKIFLLAKMPLVKLERYCVLFAGQQEDASWQLKVMPLMYKEELREVQGTMLPAKVEPQLRATIDSYLESNLADFPQLSCESIRKRVNRHLRKSPKIGLPKIMPNLKEPANV